ncbi:MAG: succinyl-diaminopimelate desuccinylase [Rhodospirillaceae bacterium]
MVDPLDLAQRLIRCPSVTPEDGGALDTLQKALIELGFECKRLVFDDDDSPSVDNLYARLGNKGPNFCFAGHTDVVPVGDMNGWTVDPFGAEIAGDTLFGRGATDMKSAIASFIAATSEFLQKNGDDFGGSISLLITGDEEGPSINGTKKVLAWMEDVGEELDACLVGEPTNPKELGDMIKIGRRGSLSGSIKVYGVQGHTAYPHLAKNPLPTLAKLATLLSETPLDRGNEHFQPSNLQITSIDVGNTATNVIPASGQLRFNVRFNDQHTGESLMKWVEKKCESVEADFDIEFRLTGEAFLTPPGKLSDILSNAVQDVTGKQPELSTTGGTSDARFIKDFCPVAEFGLISQTMHKVDERVAIKDIRHLTKIYEAVLDQYFKSID